MKILLFILMSASFISSCDKQTIIQNNSSLIIGKWVCNSFKNDAVDTLTSKKAYSLSTRYENGWAFLEDKKIQYKIGTNWLTFEGDSYNIVADKDLTVGDSSSISNYKIIELSATKLTVHSDMWKTTFFLTKE